MHCSCLRRAGHLLHLSPMLGFWGFRVFVVFKVFGFFDIFKVFGVFDVFEAFGFFEVFEICVVVAGHSKSYHYAQCS